ncbi:MAG: hypothetical protein HY062_06735 [Bacteroidetes bacterium]|nr:hypothetical protein [Bacteroidota bacterium]
MAKTRQHLSTLKSTWEKKVLKRVEHFKVNHQNYSIPSTYKYIVVSSFPEIISHYSELLVLSTNEFENWLKEGRTSEDFKIITDSFYKIHEKNYSDEDLKNLTKSGIIFGNFSK